ncbi:MAG: glycerol-3-phosphate O-acyltransferase [Bacteroidia bacterium]|jgi:glycerol-3-phosphate O-acyltransferase
MPPSYTAYVNSSNPNKTVNEAHVLLEESAFLAELTEAGAQVGKNEAQSRKYARKCLHEIAATPKESWLAPASKLARFIYTRSYEPELDINQEALDQLGELSRDHLLLFLWSHKSHMDSFVFLLSLYYNGFKPLPLVFAGINMNFLGFGSLARRVGAIFLRRNFQDDPIYKLVFRHYIDYLICNRLPLTWSIEGTRSRTGKLSPPKLGILNWVLEACERQDMKDVKLVPVSIAFDRIAEIDDYVALQQGVPKRKESLSWFINFIFGTKIPNGKIYVRFSDPIGIDEVPGASFGGVNLDDPELEGPSLATRLAFEVCTRIERITPIKSADVLTMVLLGADDRALSNDEIYQQAREIAQLARERDLPLAQGFSLEGTEQVAAAMLSMRKSNLIKEFRKGSTPVYYIPEEQQLAAAYYRNTITHYFLAAAFGEVALATGAHDVELMSEKAMWERVDSLRDLFKFEFFFRPKAEFFQEVLQQTSRRYPDWASNSISVPKQLRQQPPRFGHAILRSIAEGYYVVATTLAALGEAPVTDPIKFTANLLNRGQEMLLRKQISGSSAISRDIFETGLRMANHRDLLVGDAKELGNHREAFLKEIRQILVAIDLLQDSYNTAWFEADW